MQIAPSMGMLGTQTAQNPALPQTPFVLQCKSLNCPFAHFKGFWDVAWATMGQQWLEIALNHLFEHPKWSRNKFGKNLGPFLDPPVTPVTLP